MLTEGETVADIQETEMSQTFGLKLDQAYLEWWSGGMWR